MSKTKMLTLYFKRAKLFLHYANGGERRFVTGPTKEGPIQVPAWVAETQTYQLSIKDGSIVNLTPPEPVAATAAEPEPELEPVEDHDEPDDKASEDDNEDEAPVAKAMKSSRAGKGSITASAKVAK